MSKKRLGIISSYNELCGNAGYTKAVVQGLSKYYDVHVIPLNVNLLRSAAKKESKLHIKNLCKEIKTFDCINIQFEAGLFGAQPDLVRDRFFSIAKACKKLVLTMHRYHSKVKYPGIKSILKATVNRKLGKVVAEYKHAYSNNQWLPVYNDIIDLCKHLKAPIIVHTQRDRDLIKTRYDQVYDHPLCFFEREFVKAEKAKCSRSDFCKQYVLDEKKTFVGIFGFIGNYKGYETIIRAMKTLPANHELLIFGSQHPLSITLEESINPYLDSLLQLIAKENLTDRVKFMGSLEDDDFLKALICCDYNVLPYLEVNQGGSAIAALSLEVAGKSIFSQNRAFIELAKYAPNCFKMVSIGNYLELSQAILSHRSSEYERNLKTYHEKYNLSTSADLYAKLLN